MLHVVRLCNSEEFTTGRKFYNIISNRKTANTLARLRTGHCGLKQYQHRFNLAKSLFCECGEGMKTVEHYLLECILHAAERMKLRKKVETERMKVSLLLENPKLIKHTTEFVASIKGLKI